MAKKKPQVEQSSTIANWDEADAFLLRIGTMSQKLKNLEAEMNLAITAVQKKHQPEIDRLSALKLGDERNLQLFCEERRDEFDEKKTKTLSYGAVSFRNGAGALKTLKGWTWKSVEAVVKRSKSLRKFLVEKTSLAKDNLKSELSEKELAKIGCYIHQDENFYYEIFERK